MFCDGNCLCLAIWLGPFFYTLARRQEDVPSALNNISDASPSRRSGNSKPGQNLILDE